MTLLSKLRVWTSIAWRERARGASFWLLLGIIVWAPFPLGSNREWSWSLLALLVALSWSLWAVWAWLAPEEQMANIARVWFPALLAVFSICWAIVQTLPFVPVGWVHPIWSTASGLLHVAGIQVISLNPWRTMGEVTKLSTYLAVAWLVFSQTRNPDRARRTLDALIAIAALYALYAFILMIFGIEQLSLFYAIPSVPTRSLLLAGPFVLHNSFATFEGMGAIASLARFIEMAHGRIVYSRGIRRFVLSVFQFISVSGLFVFCAAVLTMSALIASGSRGGVFATLSALVVMAPIYLLRTNAGGGRRWQVVGVGTIVTLLVGLFLVSGSTLNERFLALADAGFTDGLRWSLWTAAWRMIESAPYLGLGLGTFQDAYPMYANQIYPFVIDKAHCDYLEFAAGLGVPAALTWLGALVWVICCMARGALIRRRDRIFSLVGVGVTVLVALHSLVDFSLQIPAVAVFFAAFLGLGCAQAYPAAKVDDVNTPSGST